jgi:cytochrome b involved in lipid metabolism
MAVVATHNTATSCWTVIDNNVYDLTNWISKHPGGPAAIQQLCGRDGTTIFHGQHGNAQLQADILATYKVGPLSR